MQTQPTAAEQVQQLAQALSAAFVKKADAEATIEAAKAAIAAADKEIAAIRNMLAGVNLGQRLAQEMQAPDVKAPE